MKMFLISDNVDTYTGMRLAGVDGVVVHERDELRTALEDVLKDKSVGIVLLTTRRSGSSCSRKSSEENSLILSTHSAWNEKCRSWSRYRTGMEQDAKKTLSRHISPKQSG